MDKTTLYTAATFLSMVVLTLLSGVWFQRTETAIRLAFLEMLAFIAVLAFLTQYLNKRKAAVVKSGMEEEILMEDRATYLTSRAPVEGNLYTTRNYVVFRPSMGEIAQFNLLRAGIVSVWKEKTPKPTAGVGDFGGVLVLRLKEQDYRFKVSDIEKWLNVFAESRFGAQQYEDLDRKKATK